jgi:hypothetical protein
MLTFEQYLQKTAEEGKSINTLFEERIFALFGTLERIAVPLTAAKIPYELIGGAAVMLHVDRVDRSAVRNTKDLDIMVHRADLERIREVAEQHRFTKARHDFNLIFTGERVRPNQVTPNPTLNPERVAVHGIEVAVIPVADLVRMKLSNNRDIDRVHVDDLDVVGLITPEVEQPLPEVLRARLQEIRNNR